MMRSMKMQTLLPKTQELCGVLGVEWHSPDVTTSNWCMAEIPPRARKERVSWVIPGAAQGQKIQERKVLMIWGLPKAKSKEQTRVNKSHSHGEHTELECKQRERLDGNRPGQEPGVQGQKRKGNDANVMGANVSRGKGKSCLLIQCISFSNY